MNKTKETSQVEVKQEVDNTEVIGEGGDMKVSEPKAKKEKPKKPSLKTKDGDYKVNLSEPLKLKKMPGKHYPKETKVKSPIKKRKKKRKSKKK